jgi:hypothetical protein
VDINEQFHFISKEKSACTLGLGGMQALYTAAIPFPAVQSYSNDYLVITERKYGWSQRDADRERREFITYMTRNTVTVYSNNHHHIIIASYCFD